MVTQRLQRALQRIGEVPADQQDKIAMIIEDALAPHLERPSYAVPSRGSYRMMPKKSSCAFADRPPVTTARRPAARIDEDTTEQAKQDG